ncbi:anti-sigma factor family protein, partial [Chloroflexota bacterium]
MTCHAASHLIDEYLENRLGQLERLRLEQHLAHCSSCSERMHTRSVLERTVRQALAGSVEHRNLSTAASARIVHEVQLGIHHAVWANRFMSGARLMATAAAAALVLIGLFVLLGRIPMPSKSSPVTLLPVRQLFLSGRQQDAVVPIEEPTLSELHSVSLSSEDSPALSLSRSEYIVEPRNLEPGQPYTITVYLNSDLPQPVDTAHVDLDIRGPTGYYQFPLMVKGPLPAHGVSVLQVLCLQCGSP